MTWASSMSVITMGAHSQLLALCRNYEVQSYKEREVTSMVERHSGKTERENLERIRRKDGQSAGNGTWPIFFSQYFSPRPVWCAAVIGVLAAQQ